MFGLKPAKIWFVCGSQHLYGPEALQQVTAHAEEIAKALDDTGNFPLEIVCRPIVTTPEQAADHDHDLAVGGVVGAAERLLDVLVPPFRLVPHPAVPHQVRLEVGEPGPQVADLHADGAAVQRGLLVRLPRPGPGGGADGA